MNLALALMTLALVGLGEAPAGPPETSRAKSKVWAVVVGIDKCRDTDIPTSTGAFRDARVVADWIGVEAGWGASNVLVLSDIGQDAPPAKATGRVPNLRATNANLDWAFDKWLLDPGRVQPGDTVVFYFAGQSRSKANHPGVSLAGTYLLTYNASDIDPATGWAIDAVLDCTGLAKKAQVVLWLDTSTTGRGAKGKSSEKGAPDGKDWLRTLARWPGVTAWLAADGRPAPESVKPGTIEGSKAGPFVSSLRKALGTPEEAHNLVGTLGGLREDPAMIAQGFDSVGNVDAGVSLWTGGARVVEKALPELIVQSGHGAIVTNVIVTADNSRMITSGADSSVRVWGLADRSVYRVLTEPMNGVEAMALNRDGTILMTGDGMGRLYGWNMKLDRPEFRFGAPAHKDGVAEIAFFPGGRTFVSLDRGGRSILWSTSQDGEIVKIRDFCPETVGRLTSSTTPEPGAAAFAVAIEPAGPSTAEVRIYDHSGKEIGKQGGPGGRITTLDLSADGKKLVAGDDRGECVVWDLPQGNIAHREKLVGEVHLSHFSKSGLLVIADDNSIRLVEPKQGATSIALPGSAGKLAPGKFLRSTFSIDGRWLAACTASGELFAWKVADPSKPEFLPLESVEPKAVSPTISPDGRTLVVGDSDGGIRSWSLPGLEANGKAEPRPEILAARGRVASLSPSSSGRYLLEITDDDFALVWDLQDGRGFKRIPGHWTSGAFLADDSKLLLAAHPSEGGDVVVVDRIAGTRSPVTFERPLDKSGGASKVSFRSIALSASGKLATAMSQAGEEPIACVWDVATGKLAHVVRPDATSLTSLDLSGDGKWLLTGTGEGPTTLWPLDGSPVELKKASTSFFQPTDLNPAITSARFCPTDPRRVVTGSRGGVVLLWDRDPVSGTFAARVLNRAEGEIKATTFSSDGKWVAASCSVEKIVRFWSLPEGGPPKSVPFTPLPHHGEQVGALAPWPGGSMIVSGGDDAAVKFWGLGDRTLIGTLVAQARDRQASDWIAFTPEGLFDGSLKGEAMVKWRVGPKVVTLEQSQDRNFFHQLAGSFAQGTKPIAPARNDDSPRIRFEADPKEILKAAREVELTLWSDESNPADLRLYQESVPIKGPSDFTAEKRPGGTFYKTMVKLRKGENRFYALASKSGAVDGRTEELNLRYDGPMPPGKVHTLAIGVSNYSKIPLKYAHEDAQKVANFLQGQSVELGADKLDKPIVLLNDQATAENIQDSFKILAKAVKEKPEDTIVLFLAGHTDVDVEKQQFCLLLNDFPFKGLDAPSPGLGAPNIGLAMRGNADVGSFRTRINGVGVLPYSKLYSQLARLDALQRLIIIDACQAGSILDDPMVQKIRRAVEKETRSIRNSYLFAARRGEPASEADVLKQGLLTYTILYGLKAPGLEPIDPKLGGFPVKTFADLDGDGTVTSDELVAYTDDALPKLSQLFPSLVMRGAIGEKSAARGPLDPGSPELEKQVKVQTSGASFPLLEVPK